MNIFWDKASTRIGEWKRAGAGLLKKMVSVPEAEVAQEAQGGPETQGARDISGRLNQLVQQRTRGDLARFAALSGVDKAELWRVLMHEKPLQPMDISNLAEAGGVRPHWLLTGVHTTTVSEAYSGFGLRKDESGASVGKGYRRKPGKIEKLFPWAAYDEIGRAYMTLDDRIGFLWECDIHGFDAYVRRLLLEDDNVTGEYIDKLLMRLKKKVFESIRSLRLPSSTVVQMSLYLENGEELPDHRQDDDPRVRLFVCIVADQDKTNAEKMEEAYATTVDVLTRLGLSPVDVLPESLIGVLRNMLNPQTTGSVLWNPLVELSKQVLLPGVTLTEGSRDIRAEQKDGPARYFYCVTPNTFHENFGQMVIAQLLECMKPENHDEDGKRYEASILYTINWVLGENVKPVSMARHTGISVRDALAMRPGQCPEAQKPTAVEEEIPEDTTNYCRVLPVMWVYGGEQASQRTVHRVKSLLDSLGYISQQDFGVMPILLSAALPFGLYTKADNVARLSRDMVVKEELAARLIPMNGNPIRSKETGLKACAKEHELPWKRDPLVLLLERMDSAMSRGSKKALEKYLWKKGIDPAHLEDAINGVRPLDCADIQAVVDACNVNADWLLQGERTITAEQAAEQLGMVARYETLFDSPYLKMSDLRFCTDRVKFSKYLPWISCEDDGRLYVLSDGTVGFAWEATPLTLTLGEKDDKITGLFRSGLPSGSVAQIILFSDDDIDHYLYDYKTRKFEGGRTDKVGMKMMESFCQFISNGTKGMNKVSEIPVRNFRLFITVKMPEEMARKCEIDKVYSSVYANLDNAKLQPRPLEASELIYWMRRLFNQHTPHRALWNPGKEIRQQIILAETSIRKTMKTIQAKYADGNERTFRCITPRSFPKQVDPLTMGQVIGGIWGVTNDNEQITSNFVYTMNIVFDDALKKKLHTKCNFLLSQKEWGSLAYRLGRKKEEAQWAVDLGDSMPFCRIMPIFWVYGDETKTQDIINRAQTLFESKGFVMQHDRGILPIMWISALPFGLYNKSRNIDTMERAFTCQSDVVPTVAPLSGDFRGIGGSELIFVGRKGQIVSFDPFDPITQKQHGYVVGGTGSGKSVFLSNMAYNLHMAGARVHIVDIGRSFSKLALITKSRYIDFHENYRDSLNPFTRLKDFNTEVELISELVMQMAYSSAQGQVPMEKYPRQSGLIKNAITWAWNKAGNDAELRTIDAYLREFPLHDEEYNTESAMDEFSRATTSKLAEDARELHFQLQPFVSGPYTGWFNGKSRFDISSDSFTVLELQALQRVPSLFRTVTMQVLNNVNRDVYDGDVSVRKLVIFDEAHEFMGEQRENARFVEKTISNLYRKGRKSNVAAFICTQSINDLASFGSVGNVIKENSEFEIFLYSTGFDRAREAKTVNFSDFEMEYIKSVKSVKNKYSEFYMKTAYTAGVARLVIDDYSYYVYSSDPKDLAKLEELRAKGLSYDEAIDAMVMQRSGKPLLLAA